MAQTNSIYNQPLSGNLGTQTYKNYNGKQVITARFYTTSAKGSGASRAQRDTRMLMPNLTLIGSQIKEWLPALWEHNKFFHRAYTHFISHNMRLNLPVMPKEQIDIQNCVWGGVQISYGTLPPIRYYHSDDNRHVCDIQVQLSSTVSNSTLGAFSKAVIAANPAFRDGDSLVFVRAVYTSFTSESPIQGYYCTPLISALTLDINSTLLVPATIKGDSIQLSTANSTYGSSSLFIQNEALNSVAFVHVRKHRGNYLASSQTMSTDFYQHTRLDNLFDPQYIDYCALSWGYKDRIL